MATLWLDRPEARNAMGPDLWRDLPRAMAVLGRRRRGAGRRRGRQGPHFSVGLDLKAMGGLLAGGGTPGGGRSRRRLHGGPGPRRPAPRSLRLQDAITAVAAAPSR